MPRHRRHFERSGWWSAVWVLAVALGEPATSWGQAPIADPVERLRQVLLDTRSASERRGELSKALKDLDTIPDLHRAIALQEWRDQDPESTIEAVDTPARAAVVDRFERRVREVLEGTDATRQLAVAQLLGEMGAWVRGKLPRTTAATNLAPDLAALLKRGPPPVVEAAARALGKVNAPPDLAVPALAKLLRSGDDSRRAAAAEALGDAMNLVGKLARQDRPWPSGATASRTDLARMGQAVLPAVARGLADAHPDVRRQCLRAIGEAVSALTAQVGEDDGEPRNRVVAFQGPQDRSEKEIRKELQTEQADLRPLVEALREQAPAAIRLLGDADPAVCLAANEALESLAEARSGLRERAARLAKLTKEKGAARPAADPLGEVLAGAVHPLAEVLGHPEVRVRLAALYVLETLETDAAPTVEAVAKVARDGNSFVRWGAARTLGRMAPREAERAVPALARLANDDNADVRLATLAGLERYGPAAGPAVPELRRAVGHRDTATRVWALQALTAIGKEARPALREVLSALSAPDAEVRLAAARVLGRVGPLDDRAVEALRKALRDSDAAVREAASHALLGATREAPR